MIKLTLKDGSILEVEQGTTIYEVAQKISEGLARLATCGLVNGKVEDLRHKLNEDCNVSIETFDSSLDGKKAYWHTTSHIMAQAVKRLFPNVKFAIGPSIENGFYYDFDVEKPFTDEDKANIEAEMKKIIKEDIEIERFSLPKEEALKLMEGQPYKQELINDLADGEEISFYKQGDFTDLCAGPHLMKTGKVKAVKILSSSGAYWRGDEHNKMLQRIYAISFPKASQVEEYMQKLEEARQRDHRKIGKDLELFMTSPLVGSGLPMYLPNGATVRRLLERYIQDKEVEMGYQHVYTPSLANTELYKVSGHWDHYKEDMFPVMKMDNEEMVLRPMNCPHHMLIYKNKFKRTEKGAITLGWKFELLNKISGDLSGKMKLTENQVIDVYAGSNLAEDKRDAMVNGKVIKNSGVANYLLMDENINSVQDIIDKMIPIKDYVKMHPDIYFACKALNYRSFAKKWDGNRPLSVQVNWSAKHNKLIPELSFDHPLTVKGNEVANRLIHYMKTLNIENTDDIDEDNAGTDRIS